jgi:hypothetical protein
MYAPVSVPNPSKGGLGYGLHMRRQTVSMVEAHGHAETVAFMDNVPNCPSERSSQRWNQQKREEGDVIPKRHTGNRRSSRAVMGVSLMLLALYRILFPKVHRDEIRAFFRAYSGTIAEPFFYSHTAITEAENALGLNRKKGSTTAYQAMFPENLLKRSMYWNLPAPYGIANILREDIINIDEADISLEHADREYRKCFISSRINMEGNYGHNFKKTLRLAISGPPEGERWFEFSEQAGTSVVDFYSFMLKIFDDIPARNPQRR